MIGMKDQCFGVEVEMTGLTRRQAAQALANYFGTEPYYVGGGYDKWSVKDPDGKAYLAIFLASEEAAQINGQAINVDGGQTLPWVDRDAYFQDVEDR